MHNLLLPTKHAGGHRHVSLLVAEAGEHPVTILTLVASSSFPALGSGWRNKAEIAG